ncbi:putative nrps-like enzyme protein [Neofusicoccum parvum]|uniref:Nrps-like enzyme protein n=1 Tax=Neofusicoccum parvum TaxID=310453 RepID=A0ACB5SGM1_9PEZI|nr:putative nrps-like enzyme protein [Neofusicoccum parvum]
MFRACVSRRELTNLERLAHPPRNRRPALITTASKATKMDTASRTVDETLHRLAERRANEPVLAYPTRGNDEFAEYTGSELNRMVTLAATLYAGALPEEALRKSSDDPPKVIGLLGVSNLEFIITFLATQRLGLTAILFSTRLSDVGYAHLVDETQCKAVLVQSRYQGAMERVQKMAKSTFAAVPMFEGTYLFNPAIMNAVKPMGFRLDPAKDENVASCIIHTSGSTGLPKPVRTYWKKWIYFFAARNMEGSPSALMTVPLYHGFGALNLIKSLTEGAKICFINANLPITGPQVLAALEGSRASSVQTVPYTLKLIADAPGGIDKLARLDSVLFGGSACPDELGDRLEAAGVRLGNAYGQTESGGLMVRSDDQWNWLVLHPSVERHVKWEDEGDGLHHLVTMPGCPVKAFTTRPDGGYDTKDLFMRHPTDPAKWKFVRRRDDTIVLVNGEKANPIPLEDAVRKHRDVQAAVAFGAQRSFMGMIVIPEQHAAGVPKVELVARIWPDLDRANQVVPAYARISRDAVIVKDAGTPFPVTEKTTVIRARFVEQFAGDIDAFYARMESGGTANDGPQELTEGRVRELVRGAAREALQLENPAELTDDADFFLLGMDSLQATNVRNRLVKEISTGAESLPNNAAFENPSVARLAQLIVNMRSGTDKRESPEEEVMGLVRKYSRFPAVNPHKPAKKRPEKEVVVLTGATGSLGCHILNTLLHKPNVQRVYCLVRADSANNAIGRVHAALAHAHLSAGLSQAHKEKIVALPSDLSQEHFALPPATYDEMAATATAVIHNAWAVNFNLGLASFEPHCIRGTHHLLALCLRSPLAPPPAFTFISTVGAVACSPTSPIREALQPLAAAGPMGYSTSKWIAEQMCATAAAAGLATRIVRIGQIVGDAAHGVWNAKEAVPLTVLAALTVGALPLRRGPADACSWLPVDVTAAAVVELAVREERVVERGHAPPRTAAVYHVCHPRSISWNADFLPALRAAGLAFEAVDGREWVCRLEAGPADPETNPPVKLLNHFRDMYGGGRSPPGEQRAVEVEGNGWNYELDMTEARKAAPSLREPKVVGREEMGKFLRYWTREAWAGLPLPASVKARM